MPATTATFLTPRDRLVYEITKEVTSMSMDDLSYVLSQITQLKAMRMAAQYEALHTDYAPDTDPHGA